MQQAILEASKYQPLLDSLTAHIAVVDKDANIVCVNKSWRDFADENGCVSSCYKVGSNYVELLRGATSDPAVDTVQATDRLVATKIMAGLNDIINGQLPIFELVYPCHNCAENRWYKLQITPIDDDVLSAIISHDNVTPLKKAEMRAEENAVIMIELFTETVRAIARAIELRDPYTAGHQRSVATLCNEIATRLKLTDEVKYGLQLGATIHDIGKIAVPSEILSRPGKLNEHEFNLIKLHPSTGYEIMKALNFPWPIAEMIYQHHERLDGTGYPRKLMGKDICLEAKIIAVADVYDAIISHRPYRPALARQAAISELIKYRGKRYDEYVVDALLDYIATLPPADECKCG